MNFGNLTTEQRNPASENIDKVSTLEMVKIINDEDKKVAAAVEKVLPQIADGFFILARELQAGLEFWTRQNVRQLSALLLIWCRELSLAAILL